MQDVCGTLRDVVYAHDEAVGIYRHRLVGIVFDRLRHGEYVIVGDRIGPEKSQSFTIVPDKIDRVSRRESGGRRLPTSGRPRQFQSWSAPRRPARDAVMGLVR